MLSRFHRDERGVAMVTVALATFSTLMLVTVSLSAAMGSRDLSHRDQNWNASLAAAEAGIDDYLYRLNRDGSYSSYSAANPPPDGNQAFTTWSPVPGQGSNADFRYTPDTTNLASQGIIKLTSTGRVGNTTRTLDVTLRRRNFLDYLYFTDYETKDPASYTGSPFTAAEAQVECAFHYYDGRDSDCTDIYFITQDTINGPLHTNDALLISGSPNFMGDTTTSWGGSGGQMYRCPGGSCSPDFAISGDPRYVAPLTLPPSNASIKAETDPVVGGTGCLYTGPTMITLKVSSGVGKMDVISPLTKSTNTGCGTVGSSGVNATNLSLPPNGVVYVQNVPASSSDPNYSASCSFSSSPISGAGLPVTISSDLNTYNCRDGDAFVSGTLKGQMTIAAEHDIVVINHMQYNTAPPNGTDLLGLVANNYVKVHHPVDCTSSSSSCLVNRKSGTPGGGTTFQNPVIHAAIVSVQHGFTVPYYQAGNSLGTLNVTGAIAQRYRGPVGTFSGGSIVSGYAKNYVYDTRLTYMSPPHFLDPVQSAWGVNTWAEKPPAYQA